MEDFLTRTWHHLLGRLEGPFWIRFVIQPVVSSIIGLLIGIKDARAARPPFIGSLLTDRLHRRQLLKEAWMDISRMFIVATLIDVVYQIIVLHWIYPGQTLFVATILALLPYALVRYSMNQVLSFWLDRHARNTAASVSGKSA